MRIGRLIAVLTTAIAVAATALLVGGAGTSAAAAIKFF